MDGQEIAIRGLSFTCRERARGNPMVLVHANISDLRSWGSLVPLVAER